MNFYNKMERKLGKYAIKNLTLIIVICYAIGYAIRYIVPEFQLYLTLDVYRILHGQVWRIITWVLIPPYERNIFFALIMILFYYSIGTVLEKTWGTFQYNLYIFSGLIFTIMGAFLSYLYSYIRFGGVSVSVISATLSLVVTTYYVNMSIFLAYACTFPDNMVLFMFIIPVKVKYLGFLYGGYIIYELVYGMMSLGTYGFIFPFVIGSSLLNFLVFFVTTRKFVIKRIVGTKTQRTYRFNTRHAKNTQKKNNGSFNMPRQDKTRHKCAVCGRTEKDGDNLVFRYCSKCDGNFEYCQDHLYTHIHMTKH